MEIKNEEDKIETGANDEAELDKALQDSIDSIKAGNAPVPAREEVKPTEEGKVKEETQAPAKTQAVEDNSKPPVDADKKDGEYDFRVPNKGKFESDESYEKRIELMDLVKRRKLAKTDEQREQLSDKIKVTKGQIKNLNGSDKITNPLNQNSGVDTQKAEVQEDETLKADRERLKQLGGATKEDIEEIIQKERLAGEVRGTLDKFIERHTELKDIDTREVFFDFVDNNYAWQNKSGKELMTVLELARESMFRPSETIQERVLKGADVQNKVNAMQFPGGTIAKAEVSPDMRKSIDELKATGMSEEKALELLSE